MNFSTSILRPNKFRAWGRYGLWNDDTDLREWEMVDADSLSFTEYQPLCYLLQSTENKEYFMQFTGLHDNEGKEIYESDIVQCSYGIGIVIFHAGCFMVEWIDDKEAEMEFLFSKDGRSIRSGDSSFKVIGNVFESPEIIQKYI